MSTSDCKDGASKSSNDGMCEVVEKLQNINTAYEEDNNISVCANCGKEGSCDNMNTCNKCKQVKYCNAACKKKHRHKHKKDCEEHVRQAAEHASELHNEKLFKQPPPKEEDCPICFLRMPTLHTGSTYKSCCGKLICSGCIIAPLYDDQGNEVDNEKCPFCRIPTPHTGEEHIKRLKKRVEVEDAEAIYILGVYYRDGVFGIIQDYTKALELFHRAGELGYTRAYTNIGYAYENGEGAEVDEKKATYYYELSAMGGNASARHNLGVNEERKGNMDRALKHYIIAAVGGGISNSLKRIKYLYSKGYATKDDYTKALQAYQEYLGEIKSKQRDEAAAAREDCRYY